MSERERDPSTTFRVGPPSPSSPAAGLLKDNRQLPISSDHIPQTPTSPPLMSVSDSNHVSNFTSSQTSPNQATTQLPSTSSPPSSTPMSTQVSQQPTLSTTNSFPTPASSVSGQHANATSIDDAGHQSFNSTSNVKISEQQNSGHRQTDHERQQSTTGAGAGVRDFAKEQTDGDAMDVDKEPVTRSDVQNLGLDSLQNHFTSAFHLCKSLPTVTGPDPSFDLISLYGLGSVAQSVARMDPVTGEKINRLRKSYEGKLKGLGLAGRNKPVKQEPGAPGSLRHLTMWPEEEWQNQKVHGKQIKVSDIDTALQSIHSRAMQLEPGMVPNNDFWEDVLGHEKPAKTQGSGDNGKKAAAPTPVNRSALPNTTSTAAMQDSNRNRPSRGRKRHYDDNSFVGYGEGYADDDEDDNTGYHSNGEGTGKKKRKKDHVSKVSTPLSERGGSYGVGMFGIGAR
ncbi:uncharacterized protein N7469_010674 [Penicillium citrinum]|uniref:Mediator of RNA polymerase II transcription subunit 19 n=1 Tax=Penicillium citrinum TaxID=5077 RepID=A0A9W9NKR5_PENCI|nr:uncharacterized protein N7469_010674 [Penicillium citrinum]KAJ5221787.1 hypothetical protein N7469_010674 [Penicillium citrinum]